MTIPDHGAGPGGVVMIRPGRRDEIPGVLELWRDAEAVPSVSDDPASLGRLLATSEDALLVAVATSGPDATGLADASGPTKPGGPTEAGGYTEGGGRTWGGGRVVGSIIAGWDGWRGNLYRLAVRPSERRRGIALRLVAEAERRLSAKGARRLTALVMSEHDPAVALWLAAGYHHDTRVGRYVRTLP